MSTNVESPKSSDERFSDARELQWMWKTPAMRAMVVAICKLALEKSTQEFSANDLILENHGGRGIAGSIFHRLANDGVLSPVGIFIGKEFQQRTVKNAGGNRIGLWRLASRWRAEALLRVDAELPGAPVQPELEPTSNQISTAGK